MSLPPITRLGRNGCLVLCFFLRSLLTLPFSCLISSLLLSLYSNYPAVLPQSFVDRRVLRLRRRVVTTGYCKLPKTWPMTECRWIPTTATAYSSTNVDQEFFIITEDNYFTYSSRRSLPLLCAFISVPSLVKNFLTLTCHLGLIKSRLRLCEIYSRDIFKHPPTIFRFVELSEEIDMDLWVQLEGEMEPVDEDTEDEGAMGEVMYVLFGGAG